jgi:hypothetical protein
VAYDIDRTCNWLLTVTQQKFSALNTPRLNAISSYAVSDLRNNIFETRFDFFIAGMKPQTKVAEEH